MSETTSNEIDKTPGIISWNELMTRDAGASSKFYTNLFGWSREEMEMQGYTYTMFKAGERPVAGMFTLPPDAESMPAVWIPYVTVENLESSLARVKELGGKVHKEITTIQMGRFAIIADPTGAILGLWQFTG